MTARPIGKSAADTMEHETLHVRQDGAVLFADIAAPPMNLLGPELVRDLVSIIQRGEAETTFQVLVFRSADPNYFISHVDVTRINEYRQEAAKLVGEASIGLLFRHLSESRDSETQRRTELAMSRGFQRHDAEIALPKMLASLADR